MIKYNDVYVQTLVRGLLSPSEQFVTAAAGRYQSFWTFGMPWFKHAYLLIATTERLIVVDHRRGLFFDRMDRVDGYRWSELGSLKLSGLFTKKLVARDTANRTLFAMKLPPFLLKPIVNNTASLRSIVQTWEQRRVLAAAPAFGQLPQQAYAAPAFAPPPPPLNAPRSYS